jgi:ParB family chromosome partitioning protein
MKSFKMEIPIDHIHFNRYQTRKILDEEKINQLAETDIPGHFEIVSGERRVRACIRLNWSSIPCEIRDISDQELAEISLIENFQREDLNPIEEAEGFQILKKEFQLSNVELGRRIGKSRPYVSNRLRLLSMPLFLKACVLCKTLEVSHALTISTLPKEFHQYRVAFIVMDWSLSLNETRRIVNEIKSGRRWIEWQRDVPISGLIEYHRAPPVSANYDEVFKSLSKNGLIDPIVVFTYGVIIEGRTKVRAASAHGWSKIRARIYFNTDWLKIEENEVPVKYDMTKPVRGIYPEMTESQKKRMRKLYEMLRERIHEYPILCC